jgi:uncharacterized damage-inducible protein DinB
MKAFFEDLYGYHHHFNQQLITFLKDHQGVLPEPSYPLLSHILNAHQIWNARITNAVPFAVHQLHAAADLSVIDRNNYEKSITIIGAYDLQATLQYTNSRGDTFVNTVQEILFHVANHTTHHRAQLMSGLRMAGITPLATDYIFYKRQPVSTNE